MWPSDMNIQIRLFPLQGVLVSGVFSVQLSALEMSEISPSLPLHSSLPSCLCHYGNRPATGS